MQIGLIDVDSYNFPNLCLMKLSAYHKALGDAVEWWDGFKHYDVVYKSKVFTNAYSSDEITVINAGKIIEGGTGYNLSNNLPHDVEHTTPDYGLCPKYNEAYGFLTRGCPRNCGFCIVSEKEGKISKHTADLSEFWKGQKIIKLLDPNILACKEHEQLLSGLIESRASVDFTQGLDARLVNADNAKLLSRVKTNMIHFAFDNIADEKEIVRGLEIYKKATGIDERKTGVYILTNYNTTHDEDLYRIRCVQERGYLPYVMIYNKPSAPTITKLLQRWCNNRIIYRASGMNFNNYDVELENKRR